MKNFNKQQISKEDIKNDNNGISIEKLLSLIENHEYYINVLKYFDIKPNDSSIIKIKGSNVLFSKIKSINEKFDKIDFNCNLKKITFDYSDGFALSFNDLTTEKVFETLGFKRIIAKPIHSGEHDFFESILEIDKYAKRLINLGYKDILDKNLELIKSKEKHNKKYRILYEKSENIFYLRAIVSEDRYYNYDNSITVVIALLKLHFEMMKSNVIYELELCEYSESSIRMFFKTSETLPLEGIGNLQNALQISNDEIRREALRFSNICSIIYKNKIDEIDNIYIKPKDIKTKVLSITHGTGPEKAFNNLSDFYKINDNFLNLYTEIKLITKIKNHQQIVFLIKGKIEKSNTDDIKKNKDSLLKILSNQINTTGELLDTFNKLILLDDLEIDSREYLRYLFYETLLNRK